MPECPTMLVATGEGDDFELAPQFRPEFEDFPYGWAEWQEEDVETLNRVHVGVAPAPSVSVQINQYGNTVEVHERDIQRVSGLTPSGRARAIALMVLKRMNGEDIPLTHA